jgi:RNA polymerase sigma factor (sigma-70 family)
MRAYTHDVARHPRLDPVVQSEAFTAFVRDKEALWRHLFEVAFEHTLERSKSLYDGATMLEPLHGKRTRERPAAIKAVAKSLAVATEALDLARTIVGEFAGTTATEARWKVEALVRTRAELVKVNLRLVFGVARRFKSIHIHYEDMVADGNMGLFRSVDRFDPAYKVQFSTYALHWIRHEIQRGIDDRGWTVRVPVNARIVRAEILKHRAAAEARGEPICDDEVAELMGVGADRIRQIERDTKPGISFDVNGIDGLGRSYGAMDVPDPNAPIDVQMMNREQLRRLRVLLPQVDHKLAHVLRCRFGLDGAPEQTLAEIGADLKISRERVRQHQMKGLQDLKEMLEHGRITTRRVRATRT